MVRKLKKWLRHWLFHGKERPVVVYPERITVLWCDMDNKMYGWDIPAKDGRGLIVVAEWIKKIKASKLREMVYGVQVKGELDSGDMPPNGLFGEGKEL